VVFGVALSLTPIDTGQGFPSHPKQRGQIFLHGFLPPKA
jgi:hypothetical protein